MLWILYLVWLCVKLLGFKVERWCLCDNFDRGLCWFMNCDSCDELKNFLMVVVIGWMLMICWGVKILLFCIDICLWILCFIWVSLIWNWFVSNLLIVWIWWLFKWLMLFILLIFFVRFKKYDIFVKIFVGVKVWILFLGFEFLIIVIIWFGLVGVIILNFWRIIGLVIIV